MFALGSILCEILTGRPAFVGDSAVEILARPGRATRPTRWTGWRIAGPTASCWPWPATAWPPEPKDRPADAGVVAGRMTAYLAGVQERLRAAELSRAAEAARAAEAEAKAAAERRARRLTGALAATVLLAGVLGGAGWRWVELQRLERVQEATERVNLALREATRLRGLAQGAAGRRPRPLGSSRPSAAEKARDLLEPGIEPGLRKQVEDLAAELAVERKQAETAAGRPTAIAHARPAGRHPQRRGRRPGGWSTDAAYADAFHTPGSTRTAGQRPKSGRHPRPAAVGGRAPVAAIDNWAAVRRDRRRDRAGAAALAAFARAAEVLEHARKAVASAPSKDYFQAGLALAEYRAGHFAEAIAAAELRARSGPGVPGLPLVHPGAGPRSAGRDGPGPRTLRPGCHWTRNHEPHDADLRQFCARPP